MDDHGWGSNKPPIPPELSRVAEHLRQRPPGHWPLLSVIAGVLVAVGLFTSYYKVDPEETGVILRLGQYHGSAGPGLHFKIPFGVDHVYKVKTGRVLKEEFGFRTLRAGVRTAYSPKSFDNESLTLTGDLNVSDIEWIVQYQIAAPFKFLFRISNPEETIRDISESVVRQVVGNSNVDEVLTTKRAALASDIQREIQQILSQYDIGVRIVTVKFQDVNPPEAVKPAFNEVNEAEQQKESLIFQAREQYNREVPKARGEAKRTIQEAEGYAVARINRAKGEAARFLALLTEYRRAPAVTKQRLYLETLEQGLPQVKEITVLDDKGTRALPLLDLRKSLEKEAGK